jgi:hypothetical protein
LTVVTAASRRLTTLVLTGAVLVPTGVLLAGPSYAEDVVPATPTAAIGEPAYEEATPDPVTGLYPGQAAPATDDYPATGGWIIGGTLQETTQVEAPAAPRPATVQAPAARPVTVTAPTRVHRRTTVGSTPGDVPAVLPFTGPGRLELQLGLGGALVAFGAVALVIGRSRESLLHAG